MTFILIYYLVIEASTTQSLNTRSKLNLEQQPGFVTPWTMHLLALCLVPDI